ncbi:MAG: hypothetical protein VX438_16810, partial [Planctomycetota bacterium]|nr:hypothetical protein [Planctomycetota bacterium]
TNVEIADIDDITIEQADATNALSVTAGADIQLNNTIEVVNLHFKAGDGLNQLPSTYVSALELIVEGQGEFNLTERNRIGEIFIDGKIAADIDGSLTLLNDFDLLVDNLTFPFADGTSADVSGIQIDTGAFSGNLTITTSNDDIRQTATAGVLVSGLTLLEVGVGFIGLDSTLNDFADVEVVKADEIEIVDGVDGMTIQDITVNNQSYLATAGLMSLIGTINPGDTLFIESAGGVNQSISSVITTNDLMLLGEGTFAFARGNNIQHLSGIGHVAADINGNLELENLNHLRVETLSYNKENGSTVAIAGLEVTGNAQIELPNVDFDQASDSPFISGGTSVFDIGTGRLLLAFGDANGDSSNDNDFNFVQINSASLVDLVDTNSFLIDESFVSDRARFEAENGSITIDRDLQVTNQVLFVASAGMAQNLGTKIDVPEILVTGTGDFVLNQLNSLGTSLEPGQIAAAIDGSLELKNDFGLNVGSLSYTNVDGSTFDLAGIILDDTTSVPPATGQLVLETNNTAITQHVNAPVVVPGLTIFDVGSSGTVNLPFSDTLADLESINENDFFEVIIDNADTVQLNDINELRLKYAFADNDIFLTSDTDRIVIAGDFTAEDSIILDAQEGVLQENGVIDSSSLMLFGEGYFDFSLLNEIGEVFPGFFAADINGDINLVNSNTIQITSLAFTDLNGDTHNAAGVDKSGFGQVDNLRIDAPGIQINQPTVASNIVLESTAGLSQSVGQTTNGIIETQNLSMVGSGFVDLTEANEIGSSTRSGDVAIDFAGDIRLRSVHGIDFDDVTFTFQSGATRTDAGINIVGSSGSAGN